MPAPFLMTPESARQPKFSEHGSWNAHSLPRAAKGTDCSLRADVQVRRLSAGIPEQRVVLVGLDSPRNDLNTSDRVTGDLRSIETNESTARLADIDALGILGDHRIVDIRTAAGALYEQA